MSLKTFLYQHQEHSISIGTVSDLEIRDDNVVWESFKRGDQGSLVYIYRRYANILFNYGCQFSSRSEYIRDCIQELFCDLIDSRKRLGEVKSIKGYLFASLKRKIVRGLKKEELLQHDEKGIELSFTPTSLPISQSLEREQYAIIERKLGELPKNQREALVLYFYEGLSYVEIAEILGIKVKSARALTYRGLDTLSRELTPYKEAFYVLSLLFHI